MAPNEQGKRPNRAFQAVFCDYSGSTKIQDEQLIQQFMQQQQSRPNGKLIGG